VEILDSKYKNVRLSPETYEKLREIKYHTNKNFIEITTNAIDMYYNHLKSRNEFKKG
jgi:predicted DNA-binding protein